MSAQQRFCPLCNRAFQEGEAVLRCEGCSVMHHPGCWVTNGGCATEANHRVTPAALAYTSRESIPGAPAPHPGEGTRTAPPPLIEDPTVASEPIPFRPAARQEPQHPRDDEPVIGEPAQPAPMIHRTLPSTVGVPAAPRRYKPPPGEQMPRKQLPKIYDGHPLFRYWYVPTAVLIAVVVAFSVIWVAGKLRGGDGDNQQADQQTPVATVGGVNNQTPASTTTAAPTAGTTPTVAPSTGAGKFSGGDHVLVVDTGDCLNVRVKAGLANDAIVCVEDGTELVVTGGPEDSDGLTWWKVRTDLGEGWAAEDYLAKKP
ncbi:MAG: RING finger protein [Dehalococcoidia bacterium]